nr:MAG TPA: hypothetical protein [Caudoviricetes sp.]
MSCKPSLALWGSYIHKSATKACHRCVAPCSKREKRGLSAISVPVTLAYRKTDVCAKV